MAIDSRCLDLSNWDYDTYDPACLYRDGIRNVIIGCQRPPIAEDMIRRAQAAGLNVMGVYGFLYHGLDITDIDDCVKLAKRYDVPFVWVDCEANFDAEEPWKSTEAPGQTADSRLKDIRESVAKVWAAGLEPGIYTGRYWWEGNTGNSREFSMLPLWHAEYGQNDGKKAAVTGVGYGGWLSPAIHQYASTVNVCGRERDHNYVLDESVIGGEWMPSKAEWDALVERVDDIALSLMAGGEERYPVDDPDEKRRGKVRTREERLATANYRTRSRAVGQDESGKILHSVAEVAEGARQFAAKGQTAPTGGGTLQSGDLIRIEKVTQ